ncbi:glycosyltransferase [Pectobacterium brasiliense]|uniref:glycosyltransferase n=1 Tax=Pectobacterium brasiliense TaxID=180957 RepID=UPI001B36AE3E|nr:glycosyltransferase [Pectobacterium brasiliense]MBQ4794604.1 glycosyltransferase [Pectobacterium versatile]MCA5918294.1 glycosyltransferase [Pectobacterium brasiliense]MCA5926167.1 glycosyltransferase [Pectobacterium brasiliense]MCA5934158.1 glycosyltransferase [Pectobacterium brasiliense]MCA5938340.1 glycosyltransferase [Pectobacterium brasiliense]
MKVAVIVMNACDIGGIERSSFSLIKTLRDGNHQVELISLYENDDISLGEKENYSLLTGTSELSKVYSYIRLVQRDTILISTYDRISIYMIFSSLLLRKNIKIITQQHADYFAHKAIVRFVRQIIYPLGSKAIVCLTNKDAHYYKKWFGKVLRIPNILSFNDCHDKSNKKSIKERSIDLLAVGRLHPVKRFEDFINVVESLHREERYINAKIYGSGDDLARLKSFCTMDLDLFPGATNNILQKMVDTKIVVVTSHRESFSMVIIEAMSAGCVVVSYDCPTGPGELIANGKNGILVKNGDVESLKNVCSMLLDDPLLCEEISKNAILESKKYLPNVIEKEWSNLFNEISNND